MSWTKLLGALLGAGASPQPPPEVAASVAKPLPDYATERFDHCIGVIFEHEGGYVNHPRDPGNCTNMGITIATLRAWRRAPSLTCQDVRELSQTEATAIYRAHYWNTICGDSLPAGVDLAVMDFAVNSGRRRAVMFLQRIVGVKQDGAIGSITLAAVRQADPATVIDRLCAERMVFLRRLDTYATFGKGWASRVNRTRNEAQLMSAESS